jgi:hypothetical protein
MTKQLTQAQIKVCRNQEAQRVNVLTFNANL